MSWIVADLSTLPTIFFETVSEGQSDQSQVTIFPGRHEQVITYGSFMQRTYQITSGTLDATESAAFISFYNNHGNITPFKFVYESETIYVRFDGGYVLDGTVADGVKKSVRFGLTEKNPSEFIS